MEEVQVGGINFVPAPSFLTYPSSADYRFWEWDGSCSPGLRKKKGVPGWVLFGGESCWSIYSILAFIMFFSLLLMPEYMVLL